MVAPDPRRGVQNRAGGGQAPRDDAPRPPHTPATVDALLDRLESHRRGPDGPPRALPGSAPCESGPRALVAHDASAVPLDRGVRARGDLVRRASDAPRGPRARASPARREGRPLGAVRAPPHGPARS